MTSKSDLHDQVSRASERAEELRQQSKLVLEHAEDVLARAQSGERSNRIERLTEEVAGLRRAMLTRAAIEQAKGIIVARTGLSPDAAFEVLVKQSQHENRKLHEIAEKLVEAAVRQRPPHAG